MKILVCTDGSQQGYKALEETAKIASGCSADEVAVIHVYETNQHLPAWGEGYQLADKDLERIKELKEQDKEERKKILSEAVKLFEDKNIKLNAIFKEGHPADTIAKVAADEDFDMVVMGRRGLGGLKKLFLGSVSNAVLQETNANVLVVK